MKHLPKKPSALLTLALNDLNKIERRKFYFIDMDEWHMSKQNKCYVCLAGSVMAASLGCDPLRTVTPSMMPYRMSKSLCALNLLREGNVIIALEELGIEKKKIEAAVRCFDINYGSYHGPKIYVPPYHYNKTAFKRKLRWVARKLKSIGL